MSWLPINTVPKNRKVLLRRNESVYAGVFVKTIKNGSIYHFEVDAGTTIRRADYWCDFPPELIVWSVMDPELADLLVAKPSYDYDGTLSARPPSEVSLSVQDCLKMEIVPGMSEHVKQMILSARSQAHRYDENGDMKPFYYDSQGNEHFGEDPSIKNTPRDVPIDVPMDEPELESPTTAVIPLTVAQLKERYAQQQAEAKRLLEQQSQQEHLSPPKEKTAQEIDALYDDDGNFIGSAEDAVDEYGDPVNY